MWVEPDDEVKRVRRVFMGLAPRNGEGGITFPWHASYVAYTVFAIVLTTLLSIVAAVGTIDTATPVLWSVTIAVLSAYAFTTAVDHERTPLAVLAALASAWRRPPSAPRLLRSRIRFPRQVKMTRTPLL